MDHQVGQLLNRTDTMVNGLHPGLRQGYDYLAQRLRNAGRENELLFFLVIPAFPVIPAKAGIRRPIAVAFPMTGVIGGKGKHVGSLVQAPVLCVQFTDGLVAGDEQADLRVSLNARNRQCRPRHFLEPFGVDLAFVGFVNGD